MGRIVSLIILLVSISSAFADFQADCVYAGWPSQKAGEVCASPVRKNPDYQRGPCGENELQCQPLLFGSGLCASTATKEDRGRAFVNCQKQFDKTGKSSMDVLKEIKSSNRENDLKDFVATSEKICGKKPPYALSICIRLMSSLEDISIKPKQGPLVIDDGKEVEDPQVRDEILNAIKQVKKSLRILLSVMSRGSLRRPCRTTTGTEKYWKLSIKICMPMKQGPITNQSVIRVPMKSLNQLVILEMYGSVNGSSFQTINHVKSPLYGLSMQMDEHHSTGHHERR